MSSPFATFLRTLRLRSGMRQHELANLLGYEQTYISAIELGVKPPSEEFLGRLQRILSLNDRDSVEMRQAIEKSRRRFVLPTDVPTETYLLCHELWEKIDRLYPAQIRAIRELVRIDELLADEPTYGPARLRRRQAKEDAEM
ncbi:helix-turn-helix domain-containing protein [Cupriavidus sp. Agwp_2]|uniref:helix-turn-helix domain-containing protein n=1 Tax=Cupriavidus sp. Agwp_2 TaxID=2897324 RepID=UPI00345F8254